MNDFFEIKNRNNGIIITKGKETFSIEKSPDDDIWFNTNVDSLELSINFYSKNQLEWKCYIIFENLMKLIIGRYILSGDYKDEYSILPKDFIDIENKTIIWHSDTDKDNILKLQCLDKEIKINIIRTKSPTSKVFNDATKVRIRTSGSNYEKYYQEFEKFFRELSIFANQINPKTPDAKNSPIKKRKLSLFAKLK